MTALRTLLVLVIVSVLAASVLIARGAIQVALGYSAKQLCSGVLVSGLPLSFVEDRDILPRMAILGAARSALQLSVEPAQGLAEAEFLGASARAVHTVARGCSLHGSLPGEPAPAMPLSSVHGAVSMNASSHAVEEAFDRAFAEPDGAGRNTLAMLVSRGGELIGERYAAPVNVATRLQGWSMNKSLMSTWVAMQAAGGDLNPTQPVATSLAGQAQTQHLHEDLNLLHLLQMESGLDFSEIYGPGSDVTRMLYRSPAMWTLPASRAMAHPPGERFAYSSGDTVLASYIWQRSLDRPYERWIAERFSAPLGLTSLVAEADASGVQVGSSYIYMNGRDWLRVGELWLDAWHGRSPMLSRQWLRDSVSARDSDSRGRYGRGFWLNTGGVAFAGLPDSLFFANGNAGQSVLVIPEWELVVVRLGLSAPGVSSGTGDFLRELAQEPGARSVSELTLHAIYRYPIKSARGHSLSRVSMDRFGVQGDRRWMLVDESGRFLSQRRLPGMALLEVEAHDDGLLLRYAGDRQAVALPEARGERVIAKVWDDTVAAPLADARVNSWLSDCFSMPIRLVYCPDDALRGVDPDFAPSSQLLNFADGFPLLLITAASVDALNQRLPAPVPVDRFRPNLVIAGAEPHAEDDWKRLRIGAAELSLVKPCSRCAIPSIDQQTGERDSAINRVLAGYRRRDGVVYFGMNAIASPDAIFSRGDPVEVLD